MVRIVNGTIKAAKDCGFMPATLFVVATPIGNLEDITARALRVLREVSLIAAEDTRRTGHLLARYAIATPSTSLHEHNEARKTPSLVERLQRGESIALVSDAGTPTVSDPGERLIRAAIDAGIRVEPIPGPSAALAALAVSGLPAGTFTFLGFPPVRSYDRNLWFERLVKLDGTAIFFEAPHRIRATLQHVLEVAGDCQAVVAREMTKTHETLVRGPISTILTCLVAPRGEFTVVVRLGHKTELAQDIPTAEGILHEFGRLTDSEGMARRPAITALARKYRKSSREIYERIERAKKLAE
jgi:16S rRNA (cytidine1402-2'-O)-methyltransferase